jgi:hypothetical protein
VYLRVLCDYRNKRAFISVNIIKQFYFVMEARCVLIAGGTDSEILFRRVSGFKGLNMWAIALLII